jgi:hypothetical protein
MKELNFMNQKNTHMKKKKFKKDIDDDILEEETYYNEEETVDGDDSDETNSFFEKQFSKNEEDEEEDDDDEVKEPVKRNVKKSDKEKFYVDPKEFDQEIMLYYDTNVLNNKLAEMVSKISNKLSYANNFINYSYREEMVGDGIIRMMKALIAKKYNHVKGTNPFSYFTRIAFNAFRNRIKKEKHIHETHEKYQQEFLIMSENYNNVLKNGNKRITKNKE